MTLPTCICAEVSAKQGLQEEPCTNEATQEDFLCDDCREWQKDPDGKGHFAPMPAGPHGVVHFTNLRLS